MTTCQLETMSKLFAEFTAKHDKGWGIATFLEVQNYFPLRFSVKIKTSGYGPVLETDIAADGSCENMREYSTYQ